MNQQNETYFATPQRVTGQDLQQQIELTNQHPIMNELLKTVSGLIAILNEHRQIVSLNKAYLESLGFDSIYDVIGMRPGESIECIHAREMPGGCGTSEYCSSCGAAIAIVTSLAEKKEIQQKCAITLRKHGVIKEICLLVSCSPFSLEGQDFLLVFLHDITAEERRLNLERIFFHDINNLIFSLMGNIHCLKKDYSNEPKIKTIHQLTSRLASELAVQKTLLHNRYEDYPTNPDAFTIQQLFNDLYESASRHPAAFQKTILVSAEGSNIQLITDYALLSRILNNLVINALEAAEKGDSIRLAAISENDTVTISVWNRQYIAGAVARRVFQSHFSTKKQSGRGFGTYSAKLFGEKVLKGNVYFHTSEEEGTTFFIQLPTKINSSR